MSTPLHSVLRLTQTVCCGVLVSALLTGLANATESKEDTVAACLEAGKLLQENDLDGALDEAEWCREGIQQLKQKQTLAVFPDNVGGFTGDTVEQSNALGMLSLSRKYSKGDEQIILELVSGSMGGLGSLTQLAQVFGSLGQGQEKMRIQRRTVRVSSEGGNVELNVQLRSGGMLAVKSSSVSKDDLVQFLKDFPLVELDDSLKR